MSKLSRPRKGSLQFAPRVRARKFLPSVNWKPISSSAQSVLGFIVYKAGMATAIVKDNTEKAVTQGKRLAVPVTVLEAPNMKVFSIRLYKNSLVVKDIVVSTDKDLKRVLKVPKSLKSLDSELNTEFDDVKVIVYSLPRQINLKKTPDMIELAIGGETKESKLEFAKSLVNKEITFEEFTKAISENKLVDVRGITKGKGFQGPVKRFGVNLRFHKSEKGVRKVGSIAPWHPNRVTFRTPQAGQMGMFSRIHFNQKLIFAGNISQSNINPAHGFRNYGLLSGNYILVKGSVQGPAKRQILVTPAMRPTKKSSKKKLELMEVVAN